MSLENTTTENQKFQRQQQRKKGTIKHPESNMMALVSSYLSIITVSISGFNSPIKWCRVAGCVKKKKDPTICCLQGTHFSFQTHVESKDIPCKWKPKERRHSSTDSKPKWCEETKKVITQ